MDCRWTVPFTMAAAAFLIFMPWTWFGLLLVFFVERFDITREKASWPKSVGTMLSHPSGLIVYALQRHIKTYYIVLLSTILTSAAFISSAFASSITWMTVTFGVLHGVGHGIFLTSSTVYTLLYFDKYRVIATSFIFTAFGLSAVVSQFVLARLEEAYGLEGALLLYGAILLNSVAIVLLARNPLPWRFTWKEKTPGFLQNALSTPRHYRSTSDDNASPQSVQEQQCPQRPEAVRKPESSSLKQVLTLFAVPSFYVLLAVVVTGDYTNIEFLSTIVDYSMDKDIELDSAKNFVTFSSIGQLVSRIVVPLLADRMPATRRPLYSFSYVLYGACVMTIPQVTSMASIVTLVTLVGLAQGYIQCIRFALLAEYLGVERTAASSGVIGVVMIPVSLVSPAVLGHFRDATGSYDSYYRLLGSVSLVAGVLFAALIIFHEKCTRDLHSEEASSSSGHRKNCG